MPPSAMGGMPPGAGAGGGAGGGGGGGGMMNGLPSAGHQTDMNHLWGVVQQLSEALAENRAQTQSIINSVAQMQARQREEGVSPTGAVGAIPGLAALTGGASGPAQGSGQVNGEAELAATQAQLSTAQRDLGAMHAHVAALQSLVADYENALALTLDKLRPFAHAHTQALLATHAHYHSLLEQERQANLDLRVEHAEWQAGLGRVAKWARLAMREAQEGNAGWERRWREVRTENRVLRRLVGWEEGEDSEEEESAEGEGGRRVSGGSGGGGGMRDA
ncbi:hypothetical protein BDY21DRAFT_389841 [Lineolata rhizophorae]|uniref:Uncharacterized protein n=1 Tax=Lineolata rhizophorae TaxID=578093 RepID=A0A6A6PEL3_9PEZI|nr:hypothetical protein BDY21DRAFT_389841 [Lineolata rhizophorae]